jgi:outer membrane protein W
MKKLAILVGALVLTGSTFAQKATTDNPFSLEGQLSFNSSTLSFQAPSLRFRYFVADNIAARLTLGMNNMTSVDNYFENEDTNTGGTGTWTEKSSMMNIGIGGEYHFSGTDKLSPYAGLDILIGSGSYTESGEAATDGAWIANDYKYSYEGKMSGFGVNLVAGADYYFAENFYFGMELGLGFMSTTVRGYEESETLGNVTVSDKGNDMKMSGFGNNFVGNFRLGWRF